MNCQKCQSRAIKVTGEQALHVITESYVLRKRELIPGGFDRGPSIFKYCIIDCCWLTAEFFVVIVRQKRAEYSTAFFYAKQNLGWQERWSLQNTASAKVVRRVSSALLSRSLYFRSGSRYFRLWRLTETPPLVVRTLIGAPPAPRSTDKFRLISP